MTSLVLAGARLWPDASGALVDVAVADGRVAAVTAHGDVFATPSVSGGAEVVELAGRWLMPGLVDHHAHVTLWAKHRARFSVAGMPSAAAAAAAIRDAISASQPAADAVLVGRGYQDALWADVPSARLLDDAAGEAGRPDLGVALLSHDLHSVWLNTAAALRLGVVPGLLREEAAFAAEIALEALESADHARVDALVREAATAAAARGVTGLMDLEMADNPVVWARRVAAGLTSLRVRAGVYPAHLDAALARGERTGVVVPGAEGLVMVGPLKLFADGALNTRTAWCFDAYPGGGHGHAAHGDGELAALLTGARAHGFEVALHAIGDRAVAEALDAFGASGARGSIEHAQLVRDEDLGRLAALGVAAGIHPEHLLDDRPVSDVLWRGRTARAFPYAALAAAGAELRMGSDAPVSPLDPWLGISASVHRTRGGEPPWEPQQALTIHQALAASWAFPAVVPGVPADLVAVDADPAVLGTAALREMPVALTVCAGRVTHRAL